MRTTFALLTCCLLTTSLSAQQESPYSTQPTPAVRAELERVREAVWVAWFANDVPALKSILAPELIAMSPGDSVVYKTLPQSLAQAAAFKAKGGKLVTLAFSNTETRVYGDVAVMYSGYELTMDQAGKRSKVRGRATEVFVKRGDRWVHPSWHLD